MQYGAQGARIGGTVGRKTGRFVGKRVGKFAGKRTGGAAASVANAPGKRRLAQLKGQRQDALAAEAEEGSPEELFRKFLYGSTKKLVGLAVNMSVFILGTIVSLALLLLFVALPLLLIFLLPAAL